MFKTDEWKIYLLFFLLYLIVAFNDFYIRYGFSLSMAGASGIFFSLACLFLFYKVNRVFAKNLQTLYLYLLFIYSFFLSVIIYFRIEIEAIYSLMIGIFITVVYMLLGDKLGRKIGKNSKYQKFLSKTMKIARKYF